MNSSRSTSSFRLLTDAIHKSLEATSKGMISRGQVPPAIAGALQTMRAA